MPFTPSHVAAVLPLRGRAGRGLPLAALAVGSMSPDLLYFQPFTDWREVAPATHTLAGIMTWDLLLGFTAWAAWRTAAGSVHDLIPDVVRRRWHPAAWPGDARGWLLVVLALLAGSVSHVLWDGFTHPGRFGVRYIPALAAGYATPLGVLPGYQLLQYGSGLVGLLIVVWVGLRQPTTDPAPRPRPGLARAAGLIVVATAAIATAARVCWFVDLTNSGAVAFAAITTALGAAAAAALLVTIGHALTARA